MLRSKTRNQIADQTTDMAGEMDDMTGDIVMIDGQVPMRDKKISPKDCTELEVVVGDGLEIAIQSGKMKFQNSARAVINSVKMAQAMRDVQKEKEMQMILAADQHLLGNKIQNNKEDDVLSNKSNNSLRKPSKEASRSSLLIGYEEKKDASKEDLMGSINLDGDGRFSGHEEIDADRLDTATADVIIDEYPADCLWDCWYVKFPWCLDETPFWQRWKDVRYKTYIVVEHKYFESVVITLILISSITLVSPPDGQFRKLRS